MTTDTSPRLLADLGGTYARFTIESAPGLFGHSASLRCAEHADFHAAVGAYLGGAIGFVLFITAGSSMIGLWAGLVIMGLFSFAESPQLQALLADAAPAAIRDTTFALYFTLAFGVGSMWTALYGAIIAVAGETNGLPIVFGLMTLSFIAAAIVMFPVRDAPRHAPATRVSPVAAD